jgi:hypothetical protein
MKETKAMRKAKIRLLKRLEDPNFGDVLLKTLKTGLQDFPSSQFTSVYETNE